MCTHTTFFLYSPVVPYLRHKKKYLGIKIFNLFFAEWSAFYADSEYISEIYMNIYELYMNYIFSASLYMLAFLRVKILE